MTEVQQRRNALAKRIKIWRVAQAIYMPQASAYLPDQDDSPTANDLQGFDDSKPEAFPLFLPSAIPEHDRSSCYKGIIATEKTLRLAQMQDSLVDLRQSRRSLRNLWLYFRTNVAGEGQKTQTKSRTIETRVNSRIARAVWRYRTAYGALLKLDPKGDWTKEYQTLRDEDNRGPLKETGEMGVGDGRYKPSWIWTTPSAAVPPDEGSTAENQEVNETARHEWMTSRARADRWVEEKELLREEMRRTLFFLEWKSRAWSEKVGMRKGSCALDIQNGIDAYARKQANVYHEVAISFACKWLPHLDSSGFAVNWVTELPWGSRLMPQKAKLPKQLTSTPNPPPHVSPAPNIPLHMSPAPNVPLHISPASDFPPHMSPAVGVPLATTNELGAVPPHPDTRRTQVEDASYIGQGKRGENTQNNIEQDLGDEDEGHYRDGDYFGSYEDEDNEDGAYNDSGEINDEEGYEYDDEYMA